MDRATLRQHVAQCIDRAKQDGQRAGYREAAGVLDYPADDLVAELDYHVTAAAAVLNKAATDPLNYSMDYCTGRLAALRDVRDAAAQPLPA